VSAWRRMARTRRHIAVAIAGLLAVGLLGASGSIAAPSVRVAEGGGATFPARSLVLSVPGRSSLSASDVQISENGQPVAGAVVRPIASAGTGDFGVVLAIDVSPTMRGAPLAEAMAAARALAAQRTGKQELAIVTFDRHATVALALTDDPEAIKRALAHTPRVGSGAYIYNALTVSVEQLAAAKIAAGGVILLSDGASEGAKPQPGNQVTARTIGAAAAAAHAQIYTVGLRDSSYTPQRMSLLARVGGGAFIESASSDLTGVFTRIEAGLTSAYVVHYRSTAPLGRRIVVSVKVDGVGQTATLAYDSPAPSAPSAPSAKHAESRSFWLSTAALVLLSCAAALLLGLALFVALMPGLRRHGLRSRVGEFTATKGSTAPPAVDGSASRPLLALERLLERRGWWPQFKADVEIAGIKRPAADLVGLCALGTFAIAVLLGIAFGTPVVAILLLVLGPLSLRSLVRYRLRKQRQLFADQLPTHLQELASTMRAGHSLVSGIASMARAAQEPSKSEWARVVADEQLGVPLEDAMGPLAKRMDSEDVGQVALVAALHHRTGGNMSEVLERVADSVRERAELRRELQALTAQARMSRYVVTALPVVVAGAIALLSPSYIRPLFHTTVGVILVLLAAGLVTAGSFVMRAITNIKV
jgi:tight adherence protein B